MIVSEFRGPVSPHPAVGTLSAALRHDPEIMPDGYLPRSTPRRRPRSCPLSSMRSNRALGRNVLSLRSREEVRAYCRHNSIPAERAEDVDVALRLTKRGVLVLQSSDERGSATGSQS
jgi:hypothetical protein